MIKASLGVQNVGEFLECVKKFHTFWRFISSKRCISKKMLENLKITQIKLVKKKVQIHAASVWKTTIATTVNEPVSSTACILSVLVV
jgi:hypothetical protein